MYWLGGGAFVPFCYNEKQNHYGTWFWNITLYIHPKTGIDIEQKVA